MFDRDCACSSILRIYLPALLLAGGCPLLPATAALAAPQQLLGKSVVVSWTDSMQNRKLDGTSYGSTHSQQRIAYVSSAGRVFVKATNRSGNNVSNREMAPGANGTSLRFEGNRMVAHAIFSGFARRLTVNFDSSFSSCTATIQYGSAGGPRTWKTLRGERVELQSVSPSEPSCSIREGNAAAGG